MNTRQTVLAATVVAGLLPFAAGGVCAQAPQAPQPRGERHAPRMRALERLDLTAEQKAKIQSLMERFRADAQALRSLAPEQRRTRMRELSTRLRSDVEAVLTPQQRAR